MKSILIYHYSIYPSFRVITLLIIFHINLLIFYLYCLCFILTVYHRSKPYDLQSQVNFLTVNNLIVAFMIILYSPSVSRLSLSYY